MYISGSYNANKDIGLGLDYTIRNRLIIGTGIEYNTIIKQSVIGLKIGIKIN